ncbi:MAG: hypothetical protein MUF47_00830 [Porphyrobacter sp.]|nr:hypothetical protein [Porphyrobacter sp.]
MDRHDEAELRQAQRDDYGGAPRAGAGAAQAALGRGIDEANYLTIESIEEIRSWHDDTGVGICLLGNEELLARIETGRHRDQFARLNRRIAMRHTQRVPLPGDVRAFCDAWGITQPDIRHFLDTIARTPDSGGLGECQQLIESGSMLAAADDRGLSLADLREAQMYRATKWIKA